MKNKLIIGILLLAVVISYAAGLAPGSSDELGTEKNEFTTAETVYFAHSASILCGEDSVWKQNVTVYIVGDDDEWDYDTNLSEIAAATAAAYINTDSKIETTAVWESPEEGSWDIIVDLNNDGMYDDECPDTLDDIDPAGFTVVLAEDTTNDTANDTAVDTTNETANDTTTETNETAAEDTTEEDEVVEEEEEESVEEETTVAEENDTRVKRGIFYKGADYTPVIILVIAIFIATGIIVWTLRTLR